MSNTYEIATALDFTKIPQDRLYVCLTEFQVWVQQAAVAQKMLGDKLKSAEFVWIDDGKHDMSCEVTVKAEFMAAKDGEIQQGGGCDEWWVQNALGRSYVRG